VLEDLRGRLRAWTDTPARRRAVTVAAALLAVGALAAAVAAIGGSRGDSAADAVRDKGKAVYYYCAACGHSGQTRIGFDEEFPIVCPACVEREAGMGFKCVGCKRVIAWRNLPTFACPHCRFFYDRRMVGPSAPPGG
jgi:DNA-directed RNA polymerase subunit RPC12/RpoP